MPIDDLDWPTAAHGSSTTMRKAWQTNGILISDTAVSKKRYIMMK
jgi:hypothetical protein